MKRLSVMLAGTAFVAVACQPVDSNSGNSTVKDNTVVTTSTNPVQQFQSTQVTFTFSDGTTQTVIMKAGVTRLSFVKDGVPQDFAKVNVSDQTAAICVANNDGTQAALTDSCDTINPGTIDPGTIDP